jgi:hypothetical protein
MESWSSTDATADNSCGCAPRSGYSEAEFDAGNVEYAFSMKHLHVPSLAALPLPRAHTQGGAGQPDTAALMAQMAAMCDEGAWPALLKNDR